MRETSASTEENMGDKTAVAEEQSALWNGRAGVAWVEAQGLLDRLFAPFAEVLTEAVTKASATRVLDVGCGTGATTLAVARRLPQHGSALGVDISEPMMAAARQRAEREGLAASFVTADAETHSFEPAGFDQVVSRFGVMFFGQPVQAFANLRRATRPLGGLSVIGWRSPEENPFMTTAERAAAPLLPGVPMRKGDGPGQFAFADAARVRDILEQSGWSSIEIRPLDVVCTLSEQELFQYITRLGPLGVLLQDVEPVQRKRIVDAVLPAFDAYIEGGEVRFTAACWDIRARA